MSQSVKAAVVGATGYTGEELIRILAGHPKVRLTYVSSKDDRKQTIQEIFPYLKGTLDLDCRAFKPEEAAEECDVVFLSLPHTVSMKTAPYFLQRGKRVIDISADYRLKDPAQYLAHYGVAHEDAANLRQAVYGLPELNRDAISDAKLIANPGCYPTGATLGLLPLVRNGIEWTGTCVIDAKSGVTGAGRKASVNLVFSEVNENFKAYKVLSHQHEPEIAQNLKSAKSKNTAFAFVPHLLPIDRGILSTIYVPLSNKKDGKKLQELYADFYGREPFVQVLAAGRFPELKMVQKTNQCHIGIAFREDLGTAVIVTAIDNLGKGAAGQAVQNMNLLFGLPEKEGLR